MTARIIEVVVGDVHARADALRALLRAVGVVDARGRRREGFWVVQVGDLLDRRASPKANLAAARLAAQALDVSLAGNHELAMLDEPGGPHGASLATLAARGWPQGAAALGDWLVTHAGVHPHFASVLPETAQECADEINHRWHRRRPASAGDPLFDWVGPARGGLAPHGGVVWLGPGEWPRGGRTPWGQICGHAPQPHPRLHVGPRWTIDLGARAGRLAALVRHPDSDRWRPVVVRAPAAAPSHEGGNRSGARAA